jgi:beta-glucanase (GH16 family)
MMGAIIAKRKSTTAANSALHAFDWSPGTATGSETVTRSGTATYINSSGNRVAATANTPRIDYSGESSNSVLGILVEPASANRATQSRNLLSGWGQSNLNIASNDGTGMDGANSLYSFTQTAIGGSFGRTVAIPDAAKLTATWYLKPGTGRWVFLTMHKNDFSSAVHCWFDLQTGLPGATSVSGSAFTGLIRSGRKLANGICECTMTAQAVTGFTEIFLQCNMASADNTWDGTSGHIRYFDSVQLETSGAMTSYIPADATVPVTRGAETVTVPMVNGSYDIMVVDSAGGEWRNAVTVSGGVYTITPKTGKRHVRKVAAYAAGALTAAEKDALAAPPPYPYTQGMVLVWRDEFTDTNVARISDSGTVTSGGSGKTWRSRFSHGGGGFSSATINNESQLYTNGGTGGYLGLNPFTISDSTLKIKAAVIPNGTANVPTNTFYEPDAPYKFYSGMISSDPNKRFIYGLFEIRSKSNAVNGTWPAFWLIRDPNNTSAGGEIDIFENIGNQPTVTHQTWHSHIPNNHISFGGPYTYPNGGTIDQWHTYAVLWEPGRVVWYVDGVQTREVLRTELNGYEMMIIANLALNTSLWQVSTAQSAIDDQTGVWDPNPANLPTYLEIDYIRVYQTSGTPDNS